MIQAGRVARNTVGVSVSIRRRRGFGRDGALLPVEVNAEDHEADDDDEAESDADVEAGPTRLLGVAGPAPSSPLQKVPTLHVGRPVHRVITANKKWKVCQRLFIGRQLPYECFL